MIDSVQAAIRGEWEAARERPGAEGGAFEVSGAVYSDANRLERERIQVFAGSWLPMVREDELPRAGDFRTFDLAGSPVVILRTGTGELRALLNVCSHRGAQVLREECGRVEQLICPYHNFVFDLDGACISRPAAESFGGAHAQDLTHLNLEVYAGWAWVRRAPTGQDLKTFLGAGLLDELHEWPFESVQQVSRQVFEAEFDWKIGVEAFLESYHLPAIHAHTAHPLLDYRGTAQADLGHHSRMSTPFRSARAYGEEGPLGGAAAQAGVPVFPGLNPVQRESNFSYLIFPCTVLNLLPNHFTLFRILPTKLGHCRFEYELYAAAPEGPAAEKYLASLEPGYQKLLEEDLVNLTWIQKGLQHGDQPVLRLCAHERRILHFRKTLDAWLSK